MRIVLKSFQYVGIAIGGFITTLILEWITISIGNSLMISAVTGGGEVIGILAGTLPDVLIFAIPTLGLIIMVISIFKKRVGGIIYGLSIPLSLVAIVLLNKAYILPSLGL